jgi:hypothetical protein
MKENTPPSTAKVKKKKKCKFQTLMLKLTGMRLGICATAPLPKAPKPAADWKKKYELAARQNHRLTMQLKDREERLTTAQEALKSSLKWEWEMELKLKIVKLDLERAKEKLVEQAMQARHVRQVRMEECCEF